MRLVVMMAPWEKVIEPLFSVLLRFFIGIFPSLTLSENIHYLFIIINLLLLLTCYHRIHRALKEATMTDKDKDTSL